MYVGSLDHNLYALNASNGNPIWNFTADDAIYSTPDVTSGLVYIGSLDGKVYALNVSDGKDVWNYRTRQCNSIFSNNCEQRGLHWVG